MDFQSREITTGFITRQVSESIMVGAIVPELIEQAGEDTKRRFVEFFAAHIRNRNTREAYLRAVRRFCKWCEKRGLQLSDTEPTLVAFYVEQISTEYSKPTVKQHLAAVRMLFDFFVTGGILKSNPASSVRGPKHVVFKGKTPVLQPEDARLLLDSIPTDQIAGLRDKALIALMLYTFARVGAAIAVNVEDVYQNGRRYWVRLNEKGGRQHEMPLHHCAEEAVLAYLEAGFLHVEKGTPLFRTLNRKRNLTENRMLRQDAWAMVKRRARQAGLGDSFSNHTMRATGITAYMMAGGTLERAQQMAAHASSRTTNMYNRSNDAVTLDEVERILI
jgi:site-specific recombinase XerD